MFHLAQEPTISPSLNPARSDPQFSGPVWLCWGGPPILNSTLVTPSRLITPRRSPGQKHPLQVSFSTGLKIDLVRWPAPGEKPVVGAIFDTTSPRGRTAGRRQQWLERCRVIATGLHAGVIREPSDGWGSPPPQHRAWASILSITAGAPPCRSDVHRRTAGGGGGDGRSARNTVNAAAGGRSQRGFASSSALPSVATGSLPDGDNNNVGGAQQPPYLICRAAPITATSGVRRATTVEHSATGCRGTGVGNRAHTAGRDGNVGALGSDGSDDTPVSVNFVEAKAGGRAGGAGGTGSCGYLVVTVGQMEAWALGGAASRWWARLGPKVRATTSRR